MRATINDRHISFIANAKAGHVVEKDSVKKDSYFPSSSSLYDV